MTPTRSSIPRWMELAKELGGVIGRSQRPVCFVLGAGCSLSSGAPTTSAVHQAIAEATSARFEGLELRQALHTMPEVEIQDILAPLFGNVGFGPGYASLAALARRCRVLVINLNWDTAMRQACERANVDHAVRDIENLLEDPPALGPTGLLDLHVHGIIGDECRYGILETLSFSETQREWLLRNGLANTTIIIGAGMTYETDFNQLFAQQAQLGGRRPSASQWLFVRGSEAESPEDRLRRFNTNAQSLTYVQHADIDFDSVAILAVDRALSTMKVKGG
jgi:hypothetical protein